MGFESVAWAQAASGGADPKLQFIPFILVALVMYFLLIRPTQKKQKKHREMITQLKRGDEVWTTGGIYGIVETVEEGSVRLRISDNTVIRILKSQVSSLANTPTSSTDKATK